MSMSDPDPAKCPFCAIAKEHPALENVIPADRSTHETQATPDEGRASAYVLLSTPDVIVFLDRAPISQGHLLIAPREHRIKVSDLTLRQGRTIGGLLSIVSRALMRAAHDHAGNPRAYEGPNGSDDLGDWNVVQNNGPRAAQVVPHVHFHLIPRTGDPPDVDAQSWTLFGRGQREDLDTDDAEKLTRALRAALREEIDRARRLEGDDAVDSLLGTQATKDTKI